VLYSFVPLVYNLIFIKSFIIFTVYSVVYSLNYWPLTYLLDMFTAILLCGLFDVMQFNLVLVV